MPERGHKERQSLATTGLGNTDHIMTSQGNWPALGLNWGWLLESHAVELIQDPARELDFVKVHDGIWHFAI